MMKSWYQQGPAMFTRLTLQAFSPYEILAANLFFPYQLSPHYFLISFVHILLQKQSSTVVICPDVLCFQDFSVFPEPVSKIYLPNQIPTRVGTHMSHSKWYVAHPKRNWDTCVQVGQ